MLYYPGPREDFIIKTKQFLDLSLFPVILLYARAPKMYLVATANKHKTKTKGFQSGMISKDDLQYAENIERTMYTIRSVNHQPELTVMLLLQIMSFSVKS